MFDADPSLIIQKPIPSVFRLLDTAGLAVAVAIAVLNTAIVLSSGFATAATFGVNSTTDNTDAVAGDGVCSTGNFIIISSTPLLFAAECTLRAAIEEANGNAGADEITFSGFLPTVAGVVEISPASALPQIFSQVTIDGYSHPSYDEPNPDASPIINILGGGTPSDTHGLIFLPGADDSVVRGLAISGFPSSGILISEFGVRGPDNIRIQGSHLGIWRGLFYTNGNGEDGIRIENADFARIGTVCVAFSCTGKRNVISANGRHGVSIRGTGNVLGGNYIGVDRTGTTTSVAFGGATANAEHGVFIPHGSEGNTIGSVGGLTFPGSDFTPISSAPNVISGNGINGIYLKGADNRVYGNRIGTNADGTFALPNQNDGIEVEADDIVIGGTGLLGNLISGNAGSGIFVVLESGVNIFRLIVNGNSVGVNVDASAPLSNTYGLILRGSNHEVTDNIISGNLVDGILGQSRLSLFARNFIGTNPHGDNLGNGSAGLSLAGIGSLPEVGSNLVGGAGQGNTIGFNTGGITIFDSNDNRVVGNFVGTNASGDDLQNSSSGIYNGSAYTEIGDPRGRVNGLGNVIGFNLYGIRNVGHHVKIQGNFIGTNAAGEDLGNESIGIWMESFIVPEAVIGAELSTPDADVNEVGNIIAFGARGIYIEDSGALSIRGNQLVGNGGPGIDLEGDGPTPNDPNDSDFGPNRLQNTPEFNITQTFFDEGTGDLQVRFAVDSSIAHAAYPLKIDLYIHDPWLTQGDQARAHLGSVMYEAVDAGSFVTATITPTAGTFEPNSFGDLFGGLRATATDANSNTSEFSVQNVPVPEPSGGLMLLGGICGLSALLGRRPQTKRRGPLIAPGVTVRSITAK